MVFGNIQQEPQTLVSLFWSHMRSDNSIHSSHGSKSDGIMRKFTYIYKYIFSIYTYVCVYICIYT
jgi:hypothetical protein